MRRTQTRLLAAALVVSVAAASSVRSPGAHAASMRSRGLCDVLRVVLPLDCGIVDPAAPPTDNGRSGQQPAGPSTQPLAELPAHPSASTVQYEP